MFRYEQTTGKLRIDDGLDDDDFVGVGYSGFGANKNNPAAEMIHNEGPIPRGMWTIGEMILSTPLHGPFVMPLEPQAGTETFGRSGFLIHGDSIVNPGQASQGCIIMDREIRLIIAHSPDKTLEVVT